ncbi:8738_t:CDS:1 [Racocetra persica]|uniref:8738_t:CDS:1 n=1 Tax=Racocetra persica TaxID=160502 RepID=A0ACA9QI36_9GLOM|nr:8738_t:CDS:1 [Racocetra persica]
MVRAQFEPLAKLWGVKNEKVPELLNREAKLIMIDGKLQPLLNNSYFGGTYIDVKVNKININTVDQSKVKEVKNSLQMKEYKNYLRFKKAINSLSQLKSTFVKIVKLAQKYNINSKIGIEPEANNVVIYLKDKNDPKNKEFIKNVKFFKPKIVYSSKKKKGKMVLNSFNSSTLVEKRQINQIVFGGDKITANYGPCSAGFWMKDQFQQDFLLTAGHCAYPYNDTSPKLFYRYYSNLAVLIGSMENYMVTPVDVGFIKKLTVNSHIRVVPNIRNIITTGVVHPIYVEYLIIGSVDIISAGIHICKSGFVTGITCGYVKSLDAVITIRRGSEDKIGGLITTAYSYYGDSGGPMFQFSYTIPFVYAVGILIGGRSNSYEAESYCEPIRTAFEYGYTLVHYPH